jgi:hypothetical protein
MCDTYQSLGFWPVLLQCTAVPSQNGRKKHVVKPFGLRVKDGASHRLASLDGLVGFKAVAARHQIHVVSLYLFN